MNLCLFEGEAPEGEVEPFSTVGSLDIGDFVPLGYGTGQPGDSWNRLKGSSKSDHGTRPTSRTSGCFGSMSASVCSLKRSLLSCYCFEESIGKHQKSWLQTSVSGSFKMVMRDPGRWVATADPGGSR